MSDHLHHIVSPSNCPTPEQFDGYMQGSLPRDEVRAFEAHLTDCPFCQEALEGLEAASVTDLSATTARLHTRIDEHTQSKGIRWSQLAIAASVTLLLLFGSLYLMQTSTPDLAMSDSSDATAGTEQVAATQADTSAEDNQEASPASTPQIALTETVPQPPIHSLAASESAPIVSEKPTEGTTSRSLATESLSKEQMAPVTDDMEDMVMAEESEKWMEEEMTDEKPGLAMTESSAGNSMSETATVVTSSTQKDKQPQAVAASPYPSRDAEATSPPTAEINEMLSYASQQINASFNEQEESRTKKDYSQSGMSISYNNTTVLREQLDLLQKGQWQTSLEAINKLLVKDVWTPDEAATLQWFRAAAQLGLGQSAKDDLRVLKQTKNPYQERAKTLFSQLY